MATNSSSDGGNSSASAMPANAFSGDWWNTTLTQHMPTNATLPQEIFPNATQGRIVLTNNSTPAADGGSVTSASNTATALIATSTSLPPTTTTTTTTTTLNTSSNSTASLTDSTIPLMTSSTTSDFSMTSSPASLATPDALPTQLATSASNHPNVMGHSSLGSSMWQASGVMIGIGCLVLGLTCIVVGIILRLRAKRNKARSTHRVRVMSGFDFNDGAEDDYQHNPWHTAQLGPATNEKAGYAMDGLVTEMNSYRHSAPTVYSIGDDDEHESNSTPHPHLHVETGYAQ